MGIYGSWEHRNFFGGAEKLTTNLTTAERQQGLSGTLRVPAFLHPKQTLVLSSSLKREILDAYEALTFDGSAGLERRFSSRLQAGLGVGYTLSQTKDAQSGTNNYALLSVPMPSFVEYDKRDNVLNPRHGFLTRLNATPYTETLGDGGQFLKLLATGNYYISSDSLALKPTFATRIAVGSIYGRKEDKVPADIRYYAGGGGPVRGYSYQSLSPYFNGNPIGGASLFETSGEVRLRFTEEFGGVLFVDAGNAYAASTPDFSSKLYVGAGTGVRYYSPIGPLRFDVAFPLNGKDIGDKRIPILCQFRAGFLMRMLRNMFRLLLILPVLGVLALGGLYGYVRSDAGLDRLTHEISLRASNEDMRLTLSGLRGNVLHEMTLDHLTVADREGVWLEVEHAHIIWNPRALLNKQAPFTLVEAKQVTLLRKPIASDAPTEPSDTTASFSVRDNAIYLPRTFRITELHIAEAIAGFEQRVAIQGNGDNETYTLALNTLQGVALQLEGDVKLQQENFDGKLAFQEAEGGVVAALLGLPNNITLALDADILATREGELTIRQANVQAGSLTAEAKGSYSLAQNVIDLALRAHAPDMAVPQALSGVPMNGSAMVNLTAKGTFDQLAVTLAVETPHLVVEEQRLEAMQLQASATLNPAAWGEEHFSAQGKVEASGAHNSKPFSLNLTGAATQAHLTLSDLHARYGDLSLDGTIEGKGTLQHFALQSDTAIRMPEGDGQIKLDGTVDTERMHYTGDAKGTLTHKQQHFEFATSLDADEAKIVVSDLALKGPGAEVKGSATIVAPLADASLTIHATDLAPLGSALGQPLSGALSADVTLKQARGKQQVFIKAMAQKLTLPGIHIADSTFEAQAADAYGLEGIDATLHATDLAADTLQAATLHATAKGGMKDGLLLALDGNGTVQKKTWSLTFSGKGQQPTPGQYRLELAKLDGTYDRAPIHLNAPATITHQPTSSSISPLTLQLAGGTVRAEGTLDSARVAAKLAITSFALQQLPGLDLPEAVLNATLDISGPANAPQLSWTAKSDATFDGMALAATATGNWKNGTLQTDLRVQSDKATATAHAALPARLSLQPFATDLSEQTALQGKVQAALPLTMFNAQLRPQGHRLGGTFSGEATLAGTLGTPYFNGQFALANGIYDHSTTGICLRNINARVSGDKQAVRLEDFAAIDSNKRRFTATAQLALNGTPTLAGHAHFDQFKLFCGGMMNGEIDGALTATGTTNAMNIAGKLELGPLNIQIPGARVTSIIPAVPVQWVSHENAASEAAPSSIALDILLSAPQQLFVRGRGLDAEFEGELAITGTATTPKLVGAFNKKRGTFTLLDRVLQLDTANLRFEGPMPPSPFLTVEASTKVTTYTITVSLSGSAEKPKLELASTPSLPQDELLALLLFGRSLHTISAFEALQLAQATRILAGLDGGGPGILGSVRDALGLDRLDVSGGGDSSVSVTTGKYISDDVYVGVTQGAQPEDRKVTTEITLTPSIQGKTAVDSVGNQSVGVEWKHDY